MQQQLNDQTGLQAGNTNNPNPEQQQLFNLNPDEVKNLDQSKKQQQLQNENNLNQNSAPIPHQLEPPKTLKQLQEEMKTLIIEYNNIKQEILNIRCKNEKYRGHIKFLSDKIEQYLEKNVVKKNQQLQTVSHLNNYQNVSSEKINPLKQTYHDKQLELQRLKKEIQKEQMQQQSDNEYNLDKVKFNNQLNEKKALLEQLKQTKEKLQKNAEDQKKIVAKELQTDVNFEKSIQKLKEELKEEKEKFRKMEKEHADKQFEYICQAELLTDLENLYRDKAKELGLIVNLTKDKDKGEEKAILFRPKPIDENKDKKPDDIYSPANFVNKITYIRELRRQKKEQDAKLKKEMDDIQFKLYNIQLQRQETYSRMKALEVESNILINRVKEMQHTHTSSQQLSISSINLNGNYASCVKTSLDIDKKKDIQQLMAYTRKRGVLREFGGNIQNSESLIFFDDNTLFGDLNILKIIKIKVFHKGNKQIYGLQAVYQTNGRTFKGQANVGANQIKDLEVAELSIQEGDQLKAILGYYSDVVCTLRFDTEKGNSLSVGSFSKVEKLQEFKIDVRSKHQAIFLFGALDFRQGTYSNSDYCLLCIGLEIRQPMDPIRNHIIKNTEEIEEDICFTEENEELVSQQRIERLINQRKIRYKLKNVAKSVHIQGSQTPNYTILGSQTSRLYSKYSTALSSIKQSYYASPQEKNQDLIKLSQIELTNSTNNLLSAKQNQQQKQIQKDNTKGQSKNDQGIKQETGNTKSQPQAAPSNNKKTK